MLAVCTCFDKCFVKTVHFFWRLVNFRDLTMVQCRMRYILATNDKVLRYISFCKVCCILHNDHGTDYLFLIMTNTDI